MLTKTFLLITVFLSFGNPSEEMKMYHKEYYEVGKIKAEGWLKNGHKNGYWKLYHQNGAISEQGYYKNDKREKYWYFYTPQKILSKEGHYKKGIKAHWWLFYDKKGRINHKCQLSNGRKNGYCLKYMDEKLSSAEKYRDGKKVKEWFDFTSFKRENNLSDLK